MTSIQKVDDLFKELVPDVGPAPTVAGEIIRAAGKIGYRWYNDGDIIGVDYGNVTCNAPARYLASQSDEISQAINACWGDYEDSYEKDLSHLYDVIIEYLEAHPELKSTPNIVDMLDYTDPSDEMYEDEEEFDEEW